MKTPSGFHNIRRELERRKFSAKEVEQIMGGNWLRLFRQTIG